MYPNFIFGILPSLWFLWILFLFHHSLWPKIQALLRAWWFTNQIQRLKAYSFTRVYIFISAIAWIDGTLLKFISENGCSTFHHFSRSSFIRHFLKWRMGINNTICMIPWTVRKAMASDVPRLFVALQMYVPWLSPVAAEITKAPSLLLFSGLFPSRSQTNDGDGLPALTTHLKITDSPVAIVRFVVGVISISGGTLTKEQRKSKGQPLLMENCKEGFWITASRITWSLGIDLHEIVYTSVMRSDETTLDTQTTQISVILIHVVQTILVFCLKFSNVIPTHFEKESFKPRVG